MYIKYVTRHVFCISVSAEISWCTLWTFGVDPWSKILG